MESSGVPFSLSLRLWEYHRHDRRIELPMHSHLFWQLNMAEAGTAEFVTPGAPPRELSAGAMLFIPPRCEHLLRYGDEPFVGFSFKMEVRGLDEEEGPPLLIPPARENTGCINAVRELLTATFPNNRIFNGENLLCDDDDYTLLVESLLSGLFRRFVIGGADTRPPLLRKLRQLLHQRHGRPLTVAELARNCNYSPGHLSELIRRECGETAKTMIDRERASMARHYLEFSDMNIGEIAAHMGFASLFAFSGFFRLHNGCSPRAFRAACRAGLDADSGPAVRNP